MRKLVTIREISEILPIQNADSIECVVVGGWKVVVRKNTFQPNDLCVFFEIDSVLPMKEEYEFLRNSCWVKTDFVEGFRIKTVKLRGQISQGLVIPLSEYPEDIRNLPVGSDLTDILEVVKWDPPVSMYTTGDVSGLFPSFIPKTDQERIQNLDLSELRAMNTTWEVTEKLEGSSMTVYVNRDDYGVCSRNYKLSENLSGLSVQWTIVKQLDLIQKLMDSHLNLAIQGELIGPKVQGNHYKLRTYEFRVFDIYNIDSGSKVSSAERIELCRKFGLSHVPVVSDRYTLNTITMDFLIEWADSTSMINPGVNREGLVFKSIDNPDISFKVISNLYLMGEK
jgi:RNA ligase (TIGR02306 family)